MKKIKNNFSLHEISIDVSTFLPTRITAAVARHFTVLDFFILEQAAMFDDVGRAYYVCAKGDPDANEKNV